VNLTKLFAFEVFPQKNATSSSQPDGGKIEITAPLRHMLDQLIKENKLESQTPITFQVDDPKAAKQVNLVRDAMMAFIFGAGNRSPDFGASGSCHRPPKFGSFQARPRGSRLLPRLSRIH
jgi:hypothetical protein